jgi:hypothetical protein
LTNAEYLSTIEDVIKYCAARKYDYGLSKQHLRDLWDTRAQRLRIALTNESKRILAEESAAECKDPVTHGVKSPVEQYADQCEERAKAAEKALEKYVAKYGPLESVGPDNQPGAGSQPAP